MVRTAPCHFMLATTHLANRQTNFLFYTIQENTEFTDRTVWVSLHIDALHSGNHKSTALCESAAIQLYSVFIWATEDDNYNKSTINVNLLAVRNLVKQFIILVHRCAPEEEFRLSDR